MVYRIMSTVRKATSWQTTLFGAILAGGLALSSGKITQNETAKSVGFLLQVVAAAAQGAASKDKDVTGGTK